MIWYFSLPIINIINYQILICIPQLMWCKITAALPLVAWVVWAWLTSSGMSRMSVAKQCVAMSRTTSSWSDMRPSTGTTSSTMYGTTDTPRPSITSAQQLRKSPLLQGSGVDLWGQDHSEDLGNGCPKLAVVKFSGVHFFKGDFDKLKL